MTQIAFSGYTGFIGKVLGDRLEARQENDLALVRKAKIANFKEKEGSPLSFHVFAQPDDDIIALLKNKTAFIHLAGKAHVMGAESNVFESYVADNIDLSIRLATLCGKAGVKRFIFVSSIGVHGQSTTDKPPFSVDDIPDPQTPYAQSKLRAEERLKEVCAEYEMDLVVVRPPLVYGPQAPGNIAKLRKMIKSGAPLPLAGLHNKRSLVDVNDLVDCLMDIATTKKWDKKVVLPVSFTISTTALIEKIARDISAKPRLVKLPTKLLQWGGKITGKSAMIDQLCGDLEVTANWQPNPENSDKK